MQQDKLKIGDIVYDSKYMRVTMVTWVDRTTLEVLTTDNLKYAHYVINGICECILSIPEAIQKGYTDLAFSQYVTKVLNRNASRRSNAGVLA